MSKNDLTELEIYIAAKEHFSKKENEVDRIGPDSYPHALCSFVSKLNEAGRISSYLLRKISIDIYDIREEYLLTTPDSYCNTHNCVYFPSHKFRMNFINSQIKRLTIS